MGHHGFPLLLRAVGLHPRWSRWPSPSRRSPTLAGFGIWVDKQREHAGVEVIRRDDYNDKEVEAKIADTLLRFSLLDENTSTNSTPRPMKFADGALGAPLRGLRTGLPEAVESSIVRTNRAVLDGGTKPSRSTSCASSFRRETRLEPHDGRQDAAQAAQRPRRAFAQPLVVLEPRRPRPVRKDIHPALGPNRTATRSPSSTR